MLEQQIQRNCKIGSYHCRTAIFAAAMLVSGLIDCDPSYAVDPPRYVEVYAVWDLISLDADATRLEGQIKAAVTPFAWGNDNVAAIEWFAQNRCFVVSHTQQGHQAVANYLKNLRTQKKAERQFREWLRKFIDVVGGSQ